MNKTRIKNCMGHRMQLVPAAVHLDSDGDRIQVGEDFWTVQAMPTEHVELVNDNGLTCRLGYDHIHNYATDPERSTESHQYGMLVLNMQLVFRNGELKFYPTRPGVAYDPPGTTKEERARIHFTPEIQRLTQQQIYVLSRCVVNFSMTSLGKPALQNDTWHALRPGSSIFYPNAPLMNDLSTGDVRRLAEFYGALQSHGALVEQWARLNEPYTFNHWNALMQSVADSLKKSLSVIEKFCPERAYHPNMPASGTLTERAKTTLQQADDALTAHIARGYTPPAIGLKPLNLRRRSST